MTKLNPIGSNQTELELADGTTVLFSYKTPVAALIPGKGWFKTECRWSVTTSKHINQWLRKNASALAAVQTAPQSFFDGLV